MSTGSVLKTLAVFVLLIVLIIALSIFSNRIWGGKAERLPEPRAWKIELGMTVGQFGQANHLPNPALKEIFMLQGKQDLGKKLSEYGSVEEVQMLVVKKMALAAEHASKNWQKIVIKFALWFAFLLAVFLTFRKRPMENAVRKWLLLVSFTLFGVIMGSDPSPMGTVKDAIHLFGVSGAVFPPRMIALTVFLLIVLAANKFICAWGCQVGTLQDLIFRLNQTAERKAVIGRQFKPPFIVTNTSRVLFFAAFTFAAFAWAADIIEPIDPFKVYKPLSIGLAGAAFLFLLFFGSLFVYRPWCHLLCPFGLVGWLVEKFSRVKISVDYTSCIACRKCATACPSTVMSAILERNMKAIPDCFACYTCRDVCPTGSINFSTAARQMPLPGHFERKGKTI